MYSQTVAHTVHKYFCYVCYIQELSARSKGRVVVLMGSPTDMDHCRKIRSACEDLYVPCELRITSAHKSTSQTLDILAEYEGLK